MAGKKSSPLQRYLDDTGESQNQFAKRSGLGQGHVNALCNNRCIPSIRTMLRIERASKKKVRVGELATHYARVAS